MQGQEEWGGVNWWSDYVQRIHFKLDKEKFLHFQNFLKF